MAEATDIKTHTRITGRISDIGLGGCYFEVMSPFARGADLQVRITRNEKTFRRVREVLYSTGGMGMGLIFTSIASGAAAVLAAWVGELSGSWWSLQESGPIRFAWRAMLGAGVPDGDRSGIVPRAGGRGRTHRNERGSSQRVERADHPADEESRVDGYGRKEPTSEVDVLRGGGVPAVDSPADQLF